jgi:ABC-type lipoprotein release transport system permease subunit
MGQPDDACSPAKLRRLDRAEYGGVNAGETPAASRCMLLTEIIRVALAALRANKLRSLLTILGIVIGVGAVIAMIALGNGAEKAVRERIARLGTTVIQINPQRVQQGGIGTGTVVKLTMRDVAGPARGQPRPDRRAAARIDERIRHVQPTCR